MYPVEAAQPKTVVHPPPGHPSDEQLAPLDHPVLGFREGRDDLIEVGVIELFVHSPNKSRNPPESPPA